MLLHFVGIWSNGEFQIGKALGATPPCKCFPTTDPQHYRLAPNEIADRIGTSVGGGDCNLGAAVAFAEIESRAYLDRCGLPLIVVEGAKNTRGVFCGATLYYGPCVSPVPTKGPTPLPTPTLTPVPCQNISCSGPVNGMPPCHACTAQATPGVTGETTPTAVATGEATPTVAMTGEATPTIAVTGEAPPTAVASQESTPTTIQSLPPSPTVAPPNTVAPTEKPTLTPSATLTACPTVDVSSCQQCEDTLEAADSTNLQNLGDCLAVVQSDCLQVCLIVTENVPAVAPECIVACLDIGTVACALTNGVQEASDLADYYQCRASNHCSGC